MNPVIPVTTYEDYARFQWQEPQIYQPYWRLVPEVVISRCPFTGQLHQQRLDTYSLLGGSVHGTLNSVNVRYSPQPPQHSAHLVQVHAFLHLNGKRPSKRNLSNRNTLYSCDPEQPFITPALLEQPGPALAVMHSVPITEIRGDHFRPAHTLYILSYYAEDPTLILARRKQDWRAAHSTDADWRVCDYWEIATDAHWNLRRWVDAGKVLWLNRDHELKAEGFPYGAIQGMRHGYAYDASSRSFRVVHSHECLGILKARG